MDYTKYILKVTLVFIVSLFWGLNFANAASVNVGPDVELLLPVSDDLHLSATTSGFDTCDFVDYMWEETSNTLFIEMAYEKDMAVIYSNDLNDNPGTYTIKLTATCNGGNPDDGGFIEEDGFVLNINGGSSNQAPTDINLSNSNVDENVATGSLVGNLSTTDSDSTNFTYTFVDYSNYPDNQLFKINNSELRIDFSPDYELKNSYSIKIKTDDQQGGTFEKVFTITINDLEEDNNSSESGSQDDGGNSGDDGNETGSGETTNSGITIHHSSYSSRMRAEANNIFKNPEKIKLNLYEDNPKNDYFYMLKWNYIGGDGQIDYELHYSKTKDFKKYKKINTKSRFYNFSKYDLEESEIYFFRVKAIYRNKESPYSNIVSIANKDNPLRNFKIKCENCNKKISYGNVFETVDLLIEKNLNIKCIKCDKKKLYYLFSDIFIYNKKYKLKIDKNKYCKSNLNFEDIFDYRK